MTTLGRLCVTDGVFIVIATFSLIFVAESEMERIKRKRIKIILQKTLIGLVAFMVLIILLAIWGVR